MANNYDKMFNGTVGKVFCKELTEAQRNKVSSDGQQYDADKTHRCSLFVKDENGVESWVGWGTVKIKEGTEVGLRRELAPKKWDFVNEGAKVFFFYSESDCGKYKNADKKSFRVLSNGPVPEKRWTFGQPAEGQGAAAGGGGSAGASGGNRSDYLKGVKIGHCSTCSAIWYQRFGMPTNENEFLKFGAYCHELTKTLEVETGEGSQAGHAVKNALRVSEDQGSVERWARYFLKASTWFGNFIDGKVQPQVTGNQQQTPPMNSQPIDNTADMEDIPF